MTEAEDSILFDEIRGLDLSVMRQQVVSRSLIVYKCMYESALEERIGCSNASIDEFISATVLQTT